MAEQANNNDQAELHFNPAVYNAAKHGNLDDLVTARSMILDDESSTDLKSAVRALEEAVAVGEWVRMHVRKTSDILWMTCKKQATAKVRDYFNSLHKLLQDQEESIFSEINRLTQSSAEKLLEQEDKLNDFILSSYDALRSMHDDEPAPNVHRLLELSQTPLFPVSRTPPSLDAILSLDAETHVGQQHVELSFSGLDPEFRRLSAGEARSLTDLPTCDDNDDDADGEMKRQTAFHRAAEVGRVAVVEALVRLGDRSFDVANKYGQTPLLLALINGHMPVIETLVRLGSKAIDMPDNNGCTPMAMAVKQGKVELIEALVRLGSRGIDSQSSFGDRTFVHSAARCGHASVVEALVRLGSKGIDARNADGAMPLHCAAREGHVETVKTLIRLGSAAINKVDKIGWSPIHHAAERGHVGVIETLVALNDRVLDAPDSFGWTPLHLAVRSGTPSAVEALVRLGSQALDAPTKRGHTPLHLAAQRPGVEMVQLLFRLGSRGIDAVTDIDETPMHVAAEAGQGVTIEFLAWLGSTALGMGDEENRSLLVEYARHDFNCVLLLLALGAPWSETPSARLRRMIECIGELDEEEVLEVRFRTYFSRSMLDRLLLEMSPRSHDRLGLRLTSKIINDD